MVTEINFHGSLAAPLMKIDFYSLQSLPYNISIFQLQLFLLYVIISP